MSLPPQIIRVKRKRTEDEPAPSFLRVEDNVKRHRGDVFLYRRQDLDTAARAAKRARSVEGRRAPVIRTPQTAVVPPSAKDEKKETVSSTTTSAAEPRRFHLSRDTLVRSALGISGDAGIRKRTRRGPDSSSSGNNNNKHNDNSATSSETTAVFVERSRQWREKQRKKQADAKARAARLAVKESLIPSSILNKEETSTSEETVATSSEPPPPPPPQHRPLPKRPSARPLNRSGQSTPGTSTPKLPASIAQRQHDTSMEQLTRDMNEYTLALIGRNLARMDEDAQRDEEQRRAAAERRSANSANSANTTTTPSSPTSAKLAQQLTPKKPALRYAERVALAKDDGRNGDTAMTEVDASDSESDDNEDDYVTETYVRVLGNEVRSTVAAAAPGAVGLLVFDHEPDMEYFYGAEEDSDEDPEDEDDENAEGYYMNDYPEDELSSDDEFGRDPYRYQMGEESDDDDFANDVHDADSDDDDGGFGGGRRRGTGWRPPDPTW